MHPAPQHGPLRQAFVLDLGPRSNEMKKRWITVFTGPNPAKQCIRIGSISETRMRAILRGMGYEDWHIENIIDDGDFTGLYNVEFWREDKVEMMAETL